MSKIALPVVGQYFGIFNYSTSQFADLVAEAPFADCNLLLIAFVHTYPSGSVFIADYENARNGGQPSPGDTDADRIDKLVAAARAANPDIKILLSLGWGDQNDTYSAAQTPQYFAGSVAALVHAHGLDGFDIDYEDIDRRLTSSQMLTLAQSLRTALGSDAIMTITPADTWALDGEILEAFDFVMPQTYQHGGNGTQAAPYARMLGDEYDTIVFGTNEEGGDNPALAVDAYKLRKAAGVFAWRMDTDSPPTFPTVKKLWQLMEG